MGHVHTWGTGCETFERRCLLVTIDIKECTLSEIASIIRRDWKPVWFGAGVYLSAMSDLEGMGDRYGCDSAKEIVLYFLANANTWKGETAREVKKELKRRLKSA